MCQIQKAKLETFKEFTCSKGSSYTQDKATFSLAVISIHFYGRDHESEKKECNSFPSVNKGEHGFV